jgi:hypothetical protein
LSNGSIRFRVSGAVAGSPKEPDSLATPPKVHGPEAELSVMTESCPASGKYPSAGPQFTKSGDTLRVIAPEVVLRNTVTDADGKKSTLTFEVWMANADGTPGTKIKLTDANIGADCPRSWRRCAPGPAGVAEPPGQPR